MAMVAAYPKSGENNENKRKSATAASKLARLPQSGWRKLKMASRWRKAMQYQPAAKNSRRHHQHPSLAAMAARHLKK
jgi:hypothetical protein